MACYHPSAVEVSRKLSADGSHRRTDTITVPCGSCLGCRTDQARDWALRMVHEADMMQGFAWFLTLTYNDESLPEHGSLYPEDFRAFVRRMRRATGKGLKYYGCGEYGETTLRPHYHAVLFGPGFLDRVFHTTRNNSPVWTSESVAAAWVDSRGRSLGLHELTSLNYQGAAYVAGYVRKKAREYYDPNQYVRVNPLTGELVDVHAEFARMSRRPGIGRSWIRQYWRDVYPKDYVAMNGFEFKPPRYYDRWMESEHRSKDPHCRCDEHKEVFQEVRHQRFLDQEEIGDEKLIMKEKIHRSRVQTFQGRTSV